MGTSTSRRSPSAHLSWRAARAVLSAEQAADRILAELFQAARADNEWLAMLLSNGMRAYAYAAHSAWSEMESVLRSEESVDAAVQRYAENTRDEGLAAGGAGIALPLAERALVRVLLTVAHRAPAAANAVEGWEAARGPSRGAFTADFLAETLRQVALHLVSCDLPAIALESRHRAMTAADAVRLTNEVGRVAVAAARAGRNVLLDHGPDGWADAIGASFSAAVGRKGIE